MKTSCKRVVSLLLVVMTIVGCCIPSFAATTTCAHNDGHQRYDKTVPSTCKDLGYELWFCETCGQYYVPSDKWIEKSDAHDYQEVIVTNATCVVDGLKRIVCSICGNVKSEEVIVATGSHTYVYPAGYDCTVGGTVTCSVDGQTYVLPAGTHAFTVTTEATHTAAGLKTCTVCGVTEVIPKVDHEFVASVKVYPDKCKDGVMLFECSCGEASYEVVIKGADHAASDLTAPYNVAATCTADGWTGRVDCKYCGERVSGVVVPALGHNMQDVVAKPATCTEDGYTAYQKCSRCDYTTGKTVVPATGHNMVFSEWIVKADCVAKTDGSAKYVCSNGCGYVENRTVSYDDHDLSHNYEIVGVVGATCTEYGYEYEVCKICGKQNKTISIEPLGHHLVTVPGQSATCTAEGFSDYKKCDRVCNGVACTYTEGKVTTPALGHIEAAGTRVEPTCTGNGSYVCSRCSATITIPALGHDFSVKVVKTAATCVAEGAYQWKCSRCNTVSDTNAAGESAGIIPIDPDAHQLSVAYQTKSPTCFSTGEKVGYCTLCLKSDAKVEVPKLEHAKFEDGAGRIPFNPATMDEADTDSYTERVIREATCYQTGLVAYKCKFCDYDGQYHWFFVETDKVAHTTATDPRQAPGCTTPGKTARTYCTVPGCTYSVGGDVIAPTHDVITKATSEKTGNVVGFTRVAELAPTCLTDGNKAYYQCDDCDKIFTWNGAKYVEVTPADVVVARLGHNIVDYKGYAIHCPKKGCTLCGTASDVLCEGNGLTDGKKCDRCGTVTEVRNPITNTDAAHDHHINVVVVPAVAPTCSTVGYEATWKCEACGYVKPATEINKLAHTLDVLVVPGNCTKDGYKYTYCTMCLELAEDGLTVVRSEEEVVTEFIKAPGHKNANGVILVEGWDCQHPTIKTKDDIKDWTDAELTCTVCSTFVPVKHNSQTIARVYAPTCSDRGYTITVCDDCGLEIVTNIVDADPNAHVYSEYTVEATYTTAGYKYKKCDLCGNEVVVPGTLAKKSAFNVKLEVFNPYGNGNKFVKSGIIGVRVILEAVEGETFDITSAQVSFDVPSTLVYRSVKFNAPAGFDASDVVISAGINAGKCVVLANTLKDANGDVITMSVSGSYALAEVYFVVSDVNSGDFDKNADLGNFSFGYAEPTVLDENYDEETGRFGEFGYTVVNTSAELGFEVGLLGDANGDGVLNAQDAQRLSNLMVDANAYDSALDVDKDGKLTMTDFMLLQGNIVGAVSDVDFYNSGLADGEKWN